MHVDDLPIVPPAPPELYDQGVCRDPEIKTEWFFSAHPHDMARARAACEACPVAVPCAEYARITHSHGRWGGVVRKEGRSRYDEERTAACAVCGVVFTYQPSASRPPVLCGDPLCSRIRRRETSRRHKATRSPGAGRLLEQGHGTVTKYQSGCRCSGCKAASNTYRAQLRRKEKRT